MASDRTTANWGQAQLDVMEERDPLFADEPEDTKTTILKATFAALAEHGYADLTIDRISQHFPKSEGLVFYHYDGKDDVLLDLLDYLHERFVQIGMPVSDDEDPETRLRNLLSRVIFEEDNQQAQEYEKALTELRMRAAQDKEFKKGFNQSQDVFRKELVEIIEDGIESGDFKQVNPALIADFLITLINGKIFEQVTVDTSRPIQSELDNYLKYRLVAKEEHSSNEESNGVS